MVSSSSAPGTPLKINLGATFDLGEDPRTLTFAMPISTAQRRPSIWNDGPGEVILALNKSQCDNWDRTEEVDKVPVPAKSSARLPFRCTFVVARTISGSAKCWTVED